MAVKFLCTVLLFLSFTRFQNALREGCLKPLGMEDGRIKDSQLEASSSHSSDWGPNRGRLNDHHAWCSDTNTRGTDYFQIDLQRIRHVSALGTQGTKNFLKQYYVTKYIVKYSFDGSMWYTYKYKSAGGKITEREFDGNNNSNKEEREEFNDNFVTRYLRIYPQEFKNDMCLRVELYGCNNSKDSCSEFTRSPSGGLLSPHHPSRYPAGVDCTWIIQGAIWQRVALFPKFFDVGQAQGNCRDNVKVLDGPHDWSTSLGTFCGGLHPTLLKSTSEFLRIQFHSSKSSSRREGFHLQFMKYTPGSDDVFAGTACSGTNLNLGCPRLGINVIHSFFGAYPFAKDCGAQISNTTCQASNARQQILNNCQDYEQCDIAVDRSSFGLSTCGNAVTQLLAVYYQCTITNVKTAPPTPITTTAAPAQTHSAPDMQTTPAPTTVNASTSSPAHNVSTTSSPIKSAPTTVGVGVAGVGEKETPPQTAADEATPNATVAVSVEASARHGMSSGSLAAVVVVAVLLVIGVLLAVILFVVCRRRSRKKGTQPPPTRYSRASLKQGEKKDSADRKPNEQASSENVYERSTPENDGYEVIHQPKRVSVLAPHVYAQPEEPQRPHAKSISNPSYDKTLTVKSFPENM